MSSDFDTLRSNEDIINALSLLYFNLNEIERNFYDIFLNPVPLTVNLQRYNDAGKLETVPIKNLASLSASALRGSGNPNGEVSASPGVFYIDNTSDYDLWYKSSGSDAYGWIKIWSMNNLNYLAPNGDGSQLHDVNVSSAYGALPVDHGGTANVNPINGLLKGNGLNPMTAAVDEVDYLGTNSMIGIICYYPVAYLKEGKLEVPLAGWIVCDGRQILKNDYPNLYAKIGDTYNKSSDEDLTKFRVPNLLNHFIRCWDGDFNHFNTVQPAQVGQHKHNLTGNTGTGTPHTHDKGDMQIKGSGIFSSTRITGYVRNGTMDRDHYRDFYSGAIYMESTEEIFPSVLDSYQGVKGGRVVFDSSQPGAWTGNTGTEQVHTHSLEGRETDSYTAPDGTENRVLNMMMVPIIKS